MRRICVGNLLQPRRSRRPSRRGVHYLMGRNRQRNISDLTPTIPRQNNPQSSNTTPHPIPPPGIRHNRTQIRHNQPIPQPTHRHRVPPFHPTNDPNPQIQSNTRSKHQTTFHLRSPFGLRMENPNQGARNGARPADQDPPDSQHEGQVPPAVAPGVFWQCGQVHSCSELGG
ncbi:hypothetical protein LINGRAHAP2_LOCUS34356 [Linum grandiflorum]